MARVRVKPSKSSSLMGMIVGGVFVLIGLTTAIPMAGGFGIFWTLAALGITGVNAYNFFSANGVATWEIDSDNNDRNQSNTDFETKLRSLNKLLEDGLISEEEFQKKRDDIINQKW
jgi:hypothetical protein